MIAPAALAQDEDIDVSAAAAYFAITTTPVGSVTFHSPGLAAAIPHRRLRGQFGYVDEEGPFSRRSFLLGLDLPAGQGLVGIDLGMTDFSCDFGELEDELGVEIDCASLLMFGARWAGRLLSAPLGSAAGTALNIGIEVAAGASIGDYLEVSDGSESASISSTNVAGGISLPLSISAKSGGTTLIPVVVPGFAFGRSSQKVEFAEESEDETESGAQFMLSAGLGVIFGNAGFGIDAGVRKVFTRDAPAVLGFGVSFRLP
jgi:hypothetical protein